MSVYRFLSVAAVALLFLVVPAHAGPINNRIYPAPKVALTLDGTPTGTAEITVGTSDGLALKGLALTAQAGRPTLLVFHGNGSSATTLMRWFAPLAAKGYGIIAAEYRGYSGNPGKPSEPGLANDADAFLAHARALHPSRLIVVGHSLGGAVALGLAGRRKVDAVVTLGAFTQLREFVPKIARGFVGDRYDNLAAVAALTAPYFLVHGTADDTVPAQMGAALHDVAGKAHLRGASFVIMGASHAPSGDDLAIVLGQVERNLDGAGFDLAALPKEIKLVPFGQAKPLNP
ncbi:MAG: alpha/beta hydrolase [Pseudomonadota bacterium]